MEDDGETRVSEGAVRTLIIDNYDSYTFNLFQLLAKINGHAPDVIRNDTLQWTPELLDRFRSYDNVVISPGPGHPANEKDFGVCAALLRELKDVPVLGVCLGHQGLAHVFGGDVVLAPKVSHGELCAIDHSPEDLLFRGIPSPLQVVRYHSWVVSDEPVPECLEPIAWTAQSPRLIMALRHTELPFWGVQFHPESICTEYGEQLLQNFRDLSLQYTRQRANAEAFASLNVLPPTRVLPTINPQYCVRWHKMEEGIAVELEHVFKVLFSEKEYCFWLNSTRVEKGLSRFSFLGPAAFSLVYNVNTRRVSVTVPTDVAIPFSDDVKTEDFVLEQDTTFFDYLQSNIIDVRRCARADLPFDFQGGVVGYLGYEMKQECYGGVLKNEFHSSTPDAAFMFADRLIAFDHMENATYLVALMNTASPAHMKDIDQWFESVTCFIRHPPPPTGEGFSVAFGNYVDIDDQVTFALERGHDIYVDNIKQCLHEIRNGESYEICLTNKVRTSWAPNDLQLFYRLRKTNPAPYAAFLRFSTFSVVCCSPEKFMTINTDNVVESKPIKGTLPRGKTVEEDEKLKKQLKESKKDFSENLMIVDLIRNDIGKVCDIGSVHVPLLMNVESYATVHQLVTTVRGKLRKDLSPCECIKQSFPPGSMTGAPKLRSLQILDRLEQSARGVYSGVLGYIGLNGCCDMCVVIRTAVLDKNGTYIGCGGAIVADSDEGAEFDEMLLKSNVLVHTILSIRDPKHTRADGVAIAGVPSVLKAATNKDEKPPAPLTPALSEEFSAEKFLTGLPSGGTEFGLQNLKQALAFLGNPQDSVPFIHVTGTNGKGSVSSTLSCVLVHCGYNVGRFISPHLVDWRESMTKNEDMISVRDFDHCGLAVAEVMREKNIPLTQFEALTAMAFYYFHCEKLDIGVIEVGMGGRRDATNVFDKPIVSVFTSISMDHAQVLGDTPAKIADEKSGIMKQGRPAVVACDQPEEVNIMMQQRAKEKCCPLYWGASPEEVKVYSAYYALKGAHQLVNLGVIAATLEVLKQEGWNINNASIRQGLESVKWPARLQMIRWKGREVLIDGAHNPAGGKALRTYVDTLMYSETQPYNKVFWVVGMLAHKDHCTFLQEVFQEKQTFPQRITTVPVKPNVSWLYSTSAAGLAKNILDICSLETLARGNEEGGIVVGQAKSVEEALDSSLALDEQTLVVLCGSLVLSVLEKQPENGLGSPERPKLERRKEQFRLLETVLWEEQTGYLQLSEHLARLMRSAYYFQFKGADTTKIMKALQDRESTWRTQDKEADSAMRVRLLVDEEGGVEIQNTPFTTKDKEKKRFSLTISPSPVHSDNTFLYHKTTNRKVYNDAWAEKGEADDVVLYNEKGEVTETCIANIAIMTPSGNYVTPPLSSGLLGGVMRQKLLEEGVIQERVITLEHLTSSPSIKLFNSVRGWFDGYLLA